MSGGLTNNINRQLQQSTNSIEKKLMKNECISMDKIFHFSEKIVSPKKKTFMQSRVWFYRKKILNENGINCASVHIYFEIETEGKHYNTAI